MAASEDARIDSLLEITESEIITGETSRQFLIGTMAPIVARICRNMGHMQQVFPRGRRFLIHSVHSVLILAIHSGLDSTLACGMVDTVSTPAVVSYARSQQTHGHRF